MIELGGKAKSTKASGKIMQFPNAQVGVAEDTPAWPLDWNRQTRLYGRTGAELIETGGNPRNQEHANWGFLVDSLSVRQEHDAQSPEWMPRFRLHCAEAADAFASGNFAEAEHSYERAIALINSDGETEEGLRCRSQVACALSSLLAHLDRSELAEKYLIAAANHIETKSENSPLLAPLYHHLGLLYRGIARPMEAVAMFDQALALLNGDSVSAQRAATFMGRGLASADMRDHASAAQSFLMVHLELDRESLRPSSRKLEAKVCAAVSLINNGDFITAEATCRMALELWEIIGGNGVNHAALWNMLGFAHARNNRLEEAIQAYRTSLRVLSESSLHSSQETADAQFNLAILYAATGHSDEADVHLRRAAEVVDNEAAKMQAREAHFRRVFLKHFQSEEVSITNRELGDVMMFSQPI